MESMNYAIELTYRIKGFDNYSFGKDNALYNIKTNRRLRQSYNNRCLGYWFGKKFMSLSRIKPLLYKPKKETLPF